MPFDEADRKTTPDGAVSFMVDDIGLDVIKVATSF